VALSIAGSDSAGGAGIAADLKTFEAHGVWGTVAVTAVTAQNTTGVQCVSVLAPELVVAQITSVASDLPVAATKTGMLGNAAVVAAVAAALGRMATGSLVVDPVVASGHGEPLLDGEGLDALRGQLLPLAAVVTPNLMEASVLAGRPVRTRAAMADAAETIAALGPPVVLVTGGHLEEEGSPDLLWDAGSVEWLEGPRLTTAHTHGTGCTLSAAVTAGLALGVGPREACVAAKAFVFGAIGGSLAVGRGVGPVDPGWRGAGR
jgi:hydroxymethylpyrimidine/phosphomethylpyrimidine kinase